MPEINRPGFREFLPSTNLGLAELERSTGKPVQLVEDPQLKVLATIRRAGAGQACHVLRIKEGETQTADYLITFQCQLLQREGSNARWMVRAQDSARERLNRDCRQLHQQLTPAQAERLGQVIIDQLLLQLRSMGPGLSVDRWIHTHCPDLRQAQAVALAEQVTGNLAGLTPSTRASVPATAGEACLSMNAAYALFAGDLLGQPYLAVPYLCQGFGPIARRLVALALAEDDAGEDGGDRRIIDGWALGLGLGDWYEWCELPE